MPQEPLKISSRLALVEGKQCSHFAAAFIRHHNLDPDGAATVLDFGGVSELRGYIETLTEAGLMQRAKRMLVIRDAEQREAKSAFDSVNSAFKRFSLPQPKNMMTWAEGSPSTCVYILPDCKSPGTLEDLLLKTAEAPEALGCVDRYMECLASKNMEPNQPHKSRYLAYIASRNQPDSRHGVAMRKTWFNFDHPNFAPLRECLDRFMGPL